MVKITCHTNLDINEHWPEELPFRPVVGDYIQSISCRKRRIELQVVAIHFKINERRVAYAYVELHLPPSRWENISAFEKWYNK